MIVDLRNGICLCVLLSVMSGCESSRKVNVHLFTDTMTESEVRELSNSVRRSGGIAHLNSLRLSEAVERPTIVIPLLLSDRSIIGVLEDGIKHLGYERVDVEFRSLGKHSYTANNIGVYLQKIGMVETSDPEPDIHELVQIYVSECPDIDAQLTLLESRELSVEIYNQTDSGDTNTSSVLKGKWVSDSDQLTLKLNTSESLTFSIMRFTRVESDRTYTGIVFLGNENSTKFSGCNFSNQGYVSRD